MLIDLETAKLHLRIDGAAEDALIEMWIVAAERWVSAYLNRGVYVDQDALTGALGSAPAALAAASAAYGAAVTEAYDLPWGAQRQEALEMASSNFRRAEAAVRMARWGMVADELIRTAVLLVLAHLYENRQEVQGSAANQIPMGVRDLLQPYRLGLGA